MGRATVGTQLSRLLSYAFTDTLFPSLHHQELFEDLFVLPLKGSLTLRATVLLKESNLPARPSAAASPLCLAHPKSLPSCQGLSDCCSSLIVGLPLPVLGHYGIEPQPPASPARSKLITNLFYT